MDKCVLVLMILLIVVYVRASELFDRLDDRDLNSLAFRLQDEREKRLLIQNDVDVIMLKVGQLERTLEDMKKGKGASTTCHIRTGVDQETKTEGLCPASWTKNGTSCYYFGENLVTWQTAAITCQEKGGHLAEIDSVAENQYLAAETKSKGGRYWVGGTDAFQEGNWIWAKSMTRISVSVTDWAVGQPDNGGGKEHCLQINWSGREKPGWNDGSCSSTREKFICEIPL